MVFHWSLRDSKSPQVSRTRLSILAVLSNTVVWTVSTRPQIIIIILITDNVENINSTNKRRDLLLANKPWFVPYGTERMLQRIQRHSRVTLYRSTHPKWKQNQIENLAMAWIDYKKVYDMVSQSLIINRLKMYKI